MTALQAIFLGLVQGVTEFLPVSSSAHLILASKLFGWSDQGLHFDMAANTGSLLAVTLFLRRDLAVLGRGLWSGLSGTPDRNSRVAGQVLVASLPVGVAGLLLQGFVAGDGRSLGVLGATSLIFGVLLAWADRRVGHLGGRGPGEKGNTSAKRPGAQSDPSERWSWRQVTWVGLAQALALIPGTSRSGVTMTAGLFSGMSRYQATRLSFVLAVPVGFMVAIKDVWDVTRRSGSGLDSIDGAALAWGTLAAALSAYVAIDWLLRWVHKHGFLGFAVYRVVLGGALLALAVAG